MIHLPRCVRGRGLVYSHIIAQLVVLQCCQAARIVIDDFSPRIVYNTPVLPESTCKFQPGNAACDGHWWYEHGDARGAYSNDTVHTTHGPGTHATLEFQGPAVALYGTKLVQFGAQAIVTLDKDAPVHVDCNVTALPDGASLAAQQLLFSKSGLDPSVPHKITVAYDDATFQPASRAWLSIDFFEVDEQAQSSESSSPTASDGGGATLSSGSTSLSVASTSVPLAQSSSPSGTTQSASAGGTSATGPALNGAPGSTAGADVRVIVGATLGGLAVALLGAS